MTISISNLTATTTIVLLIALTTKTTAFTPPSKSHHVSSPYSPSTKQTTTQLQIIGPLIRKMRGDSDAKNMPMSSLDEARLEAPGLRVGKDAWKWPPVWPYDTNFFKRDSELMAEKEAKKDMNPMSALMGGGAAEALKGGMESGSADGAEANGVKSSVEEEESGDGGITFDSLKYWNDNENVKTELDERVVEKITNHYSFYLEDGMSILELGAAENSYLPPNLKPNKHIGVGAISSQMESNPSITKSYVIDLNTVIEDEGINSKVFNEEVIGSDGNGQFDAILMANTIDFLNSPREVFKSCWRALKPGGIMIVPFLSKDAYVEKFDEAFTKQWRDMTDDQHMWVAGSFFQFSAGEGWEGLKGFDISPPGAKKIETEENILDKLKQKDDSVPPGAYVVQAKKKQMADELNDDDDVEEYIKSRLWMMPTLEDRDKKLIVPRLARAYDTLDDSSRTRIVSHLDSLPKIYASLIKMDQFAFTFSMQAQLAANLVGDPDFNGNELQINNMKMGLGLRKPSQNFWKPVGTLTAAMTPEDKVNLLAYIVPRFGTGDATQDEALEAFVSGLEPTFKVIRSKCPNMKEGDVQLLGSELLASEVLKPGRSTREEFASWLGALTDVDMEFILTKRKSFKTEAEEERKSYQEARDAETKRVEERREKIQEQVAAARESRTVMFNAASGKFEEMEQKGSGFKLPF